MWEHRCTENNFPFLFFNLLFSTRQLWDWMESNLGELEIADFRLFQYVVPMPNVQMVTSHSPKKHHFVMRLSASVAIVVMCRRMGDDMRLFF